ncbi:unnamed protein product [Plutella xylostella]|uniref:(diamondback moth) hypothetical protein n=1 Tax=Plutella xylostella TaxID=51655 RepID=A0A8S4EGK4_PLUXY|nr:unnamed protein product [Plutella xylostella]
MAAAATKYRYYIWVAGGMTGEKKRPLCSVVECYNSNTNESSMQTARMAAAATKYRDYISVAGGMTGEKKRPLCSVVECYNSNTNE